MPTAHLGTPELRTHRSGRDVVSGRIGRVTPSIPLIMATEPNSTSIGPATSRTLLSRMRKGDEAACADGLRRYTELALANLTLLGLSTEDAKDVWQEAWLRVWSHIRDFEESKGRFRSWLFRILQNRARDWNRRRHAQKRDAGLTDAYDAPASAGDPDEPSRWEELEGKCVESLEERCGRIEHELGARLRDYPAPDHLAPYRDWFFNGAPPVQARAKGRARGGRATKPAHDTNQAIAARHGLTVDQLTYRIKQVEAHLQKRSGLELPNGLTPNTHENRNR